jgi:hypothetical protein
MAGDRYRVRYEPGRGFLGTVFARSIAAGRVSQPSQAAERAAAPENFFRVEEAVRTKRRGVFIDDADGKPVWWKPVRSTQEADELVALIRSQVLNARLVDFEAWLATQTVPGD